MVTTVVHHSHSRYRTYAGDGYDGVVRVTFGGFYATGSLLFDGRAILTAAHLFEERTGTASVTFETRAGTQTLSASKILQHPGYDRQSNNDLAIVWLSESAPVAANRYDIYRGSDEVGQGFTFSGYGQTGTGATGATSADAGSPIRLKATNLFDADAAALKSYLGPIMTWAPLPGTQLIADFDNGASIHDALGQLMFLYDRGMGLDEGLIASGDSGGPAFLNNKVAGVASYTASLSHGSAAPDIDGITNSSFGDIGAWQRVSAYQQWIDQSLRANYLNAPADAQSLKKEAMEGDAGTNMVYFMVSFTGTRFDGNQIISVDYETRDGTAISGLDYISAKGTLIFYQNENRLFIPVEIIGDNIPESDEYFYLDIFNPMGGSFGEGATKLTAIRTIVDDDGWLW